MATSSATQLSPANAHVSRITSHSPYCVATGSGWKVKWEACRRCVFVRALQLGDNFSKAAPNELCAPVPIPATESFELAPRMKSRATAAITVVMADQEGQEKSKCEDRLLKRREHSQWREMGSCCGI